MIIRRRIGTWLLGRQYSGRFWQVASIVWLHNCIAAVTICFLIFAIIDRQAMHEDWLILLLTPIFIMSVLTVPLVYIDFVLVRSLTESRDEMKDEARTDYLTGLLNRRGFEESVRKSLGSGRRRGVYTLVDLDHFKRVNDTYGHHIGDKLLAAVGAALRMAVRESDLVGRLGGEELGVYMPAVSLEEGAQAAERLRLAISGVQVRGDKGDVVKVTASLGVVDCTGVNNISKAYALADTALYSAKRSGRDQVAVSPPSYAGGVSAIKCG